MPSALEEGSIGEKDAQSEEFLAWTFTPKTMILKDGHSKCFTHTAKPTQATRQHSLHIVREFEIQPPLNSLEEKSSPPRLLGSRLKPLEIRVREEDLRKCGDNLQLLSQCALPPAKPPTPAGRKKKRRTSCAPLNLVRSPEPALKIGYGVKPMDMHRPNTSNLHRSSAPSLGFVYPDLRPGTAPAAACVPLPQKESSAIPNCLKLAWGSGKEATPGRLNRHSTSKKRLGSRRSAFAVPLGHSASLPTLLSEVKCY